MNYDVASFLLASAAAARAYAPDARSALRRLLGAGVRVGAATLIERQTPVARPGAAPLDEGER
ncbi:MULTISPECIES: hypothetical protein [unclassified Streptomyces]|uniref:hypothetical protein n=1 Tax=unclassified Streptomyces TaxID=2593676 RepID=UPI0006AF088B|nr:hypothetical protein [Streptomyces sp. WM6378]KOU34889.1 hypothetical protein ADK54_39690 [Streptomyces sp. WM6378]